MGEQRAQYQYLSTRWKREVNFTPLPLFTLGENSLRYPLYRKLGGPPGGDVTNKRNSLTLARNQT
jgi:hypothetical protein